MTTVSISPVKADDGSVSYRATANEKQSFGRTAGETLDAVLAQLPENLVSAFVLTRIQTPQEAGSLTPKT
jgi:hypothetical protein